jgi:hypothetical protein
MVSVGLTVRGTGKEGGNFDVETPTFKDFHYRSKVIMCISRGCMSRRTNMTSTSKCDSSRESTNTASDNGDLELLETRGQRGRAECRIHERERVAAVSLQPFYTGVG